MMGSFAGRTEPIARRSGRVVLVDGAGRVLLFRGWDPGEPERGTWWFTPGGGLDAGESSAEGAARELYEETGLRVDATDLVGPVWERTSEFTFFEERYRQEEEFFLARVDDLPLADIDTSGFTALERSSVGEPRWWTVEELAATSDTVYPPLLAELVPDLLGAPWSGRPRRVE